MDGVDNLQKWSAALTTPNKHSQRAEQGDTSAWRLRGELTGAKRWKLPLQGLASGPIVGTTRTASDGHGNWGGPPVSGNQLEDRERGERIILR